MKPSVLSALAFALAAGLAAADGTAPRGELNIDTSLIREGATPLLSWKISYPVNSVDEVVSVEQDNAIRTKGPVNMTVRLLGAAHQPFGEAAAVNFQVKHGSDSWHTAFHGRDHQIDPSEKVFSSRIEADTVVDFAAAGNLAGARWTNSRNTLSQTRNVIALKDGDEVPGHLPAFRPGSIKDHVSPYIQDGKIVLGPHELIYFIELGQSDPSDAGFDLQDLVAVATFEPIIEVKQDEDGEEDEEDEDAGAKPQSVNPGYKPYVLPAKPPPATKPIHKPFRSR